MSSIFGLISLGLTDQTKTELVNQNPLICKISEAFFKNVFMGKT